MLTDIFKTHHLQQALLPDVDSQQWLAFIVLKEMFPDMTYLSMDGYHCHGIADYTHDLRWQSKDIVKHSLKLSVYQTTVDFCEMTTNQIINVWLFVAGIVTDEQKAALLRKIA